MKKNVVGILVGLLGIMGLSDLAQASTFTFQDIFFSKLQNKVLTGVYPVTANIFSASKSLLYRERLSSVKFSAGGAFKIVLGASGGLTPNVLNHAPTLNLVLQVNQDRVTFPINSVPYSLTTQVADSALAIPASVISGAFSTFNVRSDFMVSSGNSSVFAVRKQKRVGVGTSTPAYLLDVAGNMNMTQVLYRGGDVRNSFVWKANPNRPSAIYVNDPGRFVGIRTNNPAYELHVEGIVNASEYYFDGHPLSQSLDWKLSNPVLRFLYFKNLDSKVGIGFASPREKLDVKGAIRLGTTSSTNVGTIRWTGLSFQGYVDKAGAKKWIPLGGVQGQGEAGRLAIWTGRNLQTVSNNLTSSPIVMDPTRNIMGIGGSTSAKMGVVGNASTLPLVNISTTTTANVLLVSASGNVGLSRSNPSVKLHVNGYIDASDFKREGEELVSTLVLDDVWFRQPSSQSIYYNKANVGIGIPSPRTLLEISSPTGLPDYDPVLSLSNSRTGVSYTMGVSLQSRATFRIEKGTVLGQSTPLFVAQEDRLGIGVDPPKANLNVSGNIGVIFSGQFTNTGNVPISGPGTRFVWVPGRAALRVGSASNQEFDFAAIGLDSMAFGRNSYAPGNFSAIMGGQNNVATGAYSVVLGGQINRAYGDYSLAMGQRAIAGHHGSFVWGDGQNVDFGTVALNQFLIRTSGGVGIGLTQTSGVGLTISTSNINATILTLTNGTTNPLSIRAKGNTIIGGSGQESTALRLSVLNGPVGVGSSTMNAFVGIKPQNTVANLLTVIPQGTTTPSFVVTTTLNVGVKRQPRLDLFPGVRSLYGTVQVATGTVKATKYTFPDGQTISNAAPNYVWQKNGPHDIFYVSGNVGIGTTKPASILELSNETSKAFGNEVEPFIGFDIDGIDRAHMGVFRTMPDIFQMGAGNPLISPSPLNVVGKRIGIGTTTPRALLDVRGKALVTSKVFVASRNSAYSVNVSGNMWTTKFFLNGNILSAGGTPWLLLNNPSRLFYDTTLDPEARLYSFVGIGTSTPMAELDIPGTLNIRAEPDTDSLYISRLLRVNNTYTGRRIAFTDRDDTTSTLYVENNALFLQGTGPRASVSDVFSRGNGLKGNLAIWGQGTTNAFDTLSESAVFWVSGNTGTSKQISVTGDILVLDKQTFPSSFTYTQSIRLGNPDLFSILDFQTDLDHNGIPSNAKSFAQKKVEIDVVSWPSLNPARSMVLIGKNIKMSQPSTAKFTASGSLVGVNVDMSGVAVQSRGDKGYKYAGIFLAKQSSGIVGINTTPNAELDVKGTVIATSFNIAQRLSVSTLNMTGVLNIMTRGKVGVGTDVLPYPLTVKGKVTTDRLRAGGVVANELSIGAAQFLAKNNAVGIGSTAPASTFDLFRTYNSLTFHPFTFLTLVSTINMGGIGSQSYTHTITGFDLSIRSVARPGYWANDPTPNFFGALDGTPKDAKGIIIGVNGLNLSTSANTATGFSVTVPRKSDGSIGYPAGVFLGGNVGIGVTNPQDTLFVNGTVIASNAPSAKLLTQQEGASFNYLVVSSTPASSSTTPSMTVKGPLVAKNIWVNKLYQQDLRVQQPLQLFNKGLLVPGGLIAKVVSTNRVSANRVIADTVSNKGWTKLNAMAVSGAQLPQDGDLAITGKLTAKRVTPSRVIKATSVSANHSLYVTSGAGVGIGVSSPQSVLDVLITQGDRVAPFAADDHTKWNAVILNNPTATADRAVGVVLVPNPDGQSSHIGSGFVAGRVLTGGKSGSYLSFITDPVNGVPQERLRIHATGNVGIGVYTPTSYALDVTKNTQIRQDLSVDTKIVAASIRSIQSLKISTLNTPASINVSGSLITEKSVLFKPLTRLGLLNTYGAVFEEPSSKGLYYQTVLKNGETVSGNLSTTVNISPNSFPFFNTNHRISGTKELKIITANIITGGTLAKFQVATLNTAVVPTGHVKSEKVSFVPTSSLMTSHTSERIAMVLGARTAASTTTFTGAEVTLIGGPIHQEESAIGLAVRQLDTLKPESRTAQGSPVVGKKVAAVFLTGAQSSGNVSIATSPNRLALPSANLHILAQEIGQDALWIKSTTQTNVDSAALFVGSDGGVSLGKKASTGKLTVSGDGMSVINKDGSPLLQVSDAGFVGIKTANPSAALQVSGKMLVNTINMSGGLSGGTLQVATASGGLTVLSTGVGIGVTAPQAQLHLFKEFSNPTQLTSAFLFNQVRIKNSVDLGKNITGVLVSAKTDEGSLFGLSTQGPENQMVGMNVNLSTLRGLTGSRVVGVRSDVTSSNFLGGRKAAYFVGGRVGIGTTAPSTDLEIAGDLKAKNLIAKTSLDIRSATFNSLIVTDSVPRIESAKMFNPVVNELTIQSGVSLNLIQTRTKRLLTIDALSAKDVTTNLLSINDARQPAAIAPVDRFRTLYVSGRASMSNLAVTGNVRLDQLNFSSQGQINATKVILQASTVQTVTGSMAATVFRQVPFEVNNNTNTQSGVLYINPNDNNSLNYKFYRVTTANLSSRLNGKNTYLPSFDDTGLLTGVGFFYLTATTNYQNLNVPFQKFTIATTNSLSVPSGSARLVVSTNVGTDRYSDVVTAEKITYKFRDRTSTNLSFKGVDISLKGDPLEVGGQPVAERSVGLNVDLRNLKTSSSTRLPSGEDRLIQGNAYAGLFMSGADATGNVFVIPNVLPALNGLKPSANLNIVMSVSTRNSDAFAVSSIENNVSKKRLTVSPMGFVGIGATPDATLKTRVVLTATNEANAPPAFDIKSSAGSSLFFQSLDGKVGLGNSSPSALLSITNTSVDSYSFYAKTISPTLNQTMPFVIDSLGKIGIAKTNPQAMMDLQFTNVLYKKWVQLNYYDYHSNEVAKYIAPYHVPDPTFDGRQVVINPGNKELWFGFDERGGKAYVEDTVYSNGNPFSSGRAFLANPRIDVLRAVSKIGTKVPSFNGITLGVHGTLGIQTPAQSTFSITASRNILAGTYATGVFPSEFKAGGQGKLQGFGSILENNFALFGLVRTRPDSFYNKHSATLLFGKSTDATLKFVTGTGEGVERMRINATGGIGLGQTNPQASLHITTTEILDRPLQIDSATRNVLVVSELGYVGIKNLNPKAPLDVSGNLSVGKVKNAPDGTTMEAKNFIVNLLQTRNQSSANVTLRRTVKTNQPFVLNDASMTVQNDMTVPISGVFVTMNGRINTISGTPAQDTFKKHITGLQVSIDSSFSTAPASWDLLVSGNAMAAMLVGGSTVIGKAPRYDKVGSGSGMRAYQSSLQVYAMTSTGNAKISSASILALESSRAGVSSYFKISHAGSVIAKSRVLPQLFRLTGVISQADSFTMWKKMMDSGLLAVGNATGNIAQLIPTGDYLGQTLHSNTTINTIGRQVLTDLTTKQVFKLTGGMDTKKGSILLLSGSTYASSTLTPTSNLMVGRVGIGFRDKDSVTTNAALVDVSLVVSGNVRVGATSNAIFAQNNGVGAHLFFSGADPSTLTTDGDNGADLWMARYNSAQGASELRVGLSDSNQQRPKTSFMVMRGATLNFMATSTVNPVLVAKVAPYFNYASYDIAIPPTATPDKLEGRVAIGTANPIASAFHVVGSAGKTGSPSTRNFLVLIDNTNSGSGTPRKDLAIALTGNPNKDDANYITFMVPSANAADKSAEGPKTIIGAIEATDGGGGVQYTSNQADYAEYIAKRTRDEVLEPADIVGISEGLVSKQTDHAQQVMVMSSSPIIVGNWKKEEKDQALVAFLGQVKVKVMGPVSSGQYVVASGLNDGTGCAYWAKDLSIEQLELIVGRALETNLSEGLKKVTTLVGYPTQWQVAALKLEKLDHLRLQLKEEQAASKVVTDRINAMLQARDKMIQQLKLKLQASR